MLVTTVVPGPHVVTVEQTVDVMVLKVVAPDGVKTLSVAEQLGTPDPKQEDSEAVEVGESDVRDGVLEGVTLESSVSSSLVSSPSVSSELGFGGSEGGVGGLLLLFLRLRRRRRRWDTQERHQAYRVT